MVYLKNFIYNPGGENESGNADSANNEDQKEIKEDPAENKEKDKNEKTVIEKIRGALQDWSNKDQLDTEFDDSRV